MFITLIIKVINVFINLLVVFLSHVISFFYENQFSFINPSNVQALTSNQTSLYHVPHPLLSHASFVAWVHTQKSPHCLSPSCTEPQSSSQFIAENTNDSLQSYPVLPPSISISYRYNYICLLPSHPMTTRSHNNIFKPKQLFFIYDSSNQTCSTHCYCNSN